MRHGAVFSISDHHRGVNGGGGGGKKNPQGNTVYNMLVTQEGVSAWREVTSRQNWGYNGSISYVTAHQHSCRGLVFTSAGGSATLAGADGTFTRGDRFKNVTRGSECEPLNMLTADNFLHEICLDNNRGGRPILGELSLYPLVCVLSVPH